MKGVYNFILTFIINLYLVKSSVIKETDFYRLDIIHYNDFHSRFEETTESVSVCHWNNASCLGGFARLYHEVTALKAAAVNPLVLNAGDVFQGSYWYTLLKWPVVAEFVNMLPTDAHTLGNHEFDDSVSGLVPYLNALRSPIVLANVNLTKEPGLQDLVQPSIIIEKKGRKIGIIGLIIPETANASITDNVIFLDPIKTTREVAQQLTDQGVDIIILLSHCGLYIDKDIAKKAGRYVDVIVGGHTHALLWNGDSPTKERIYGPYPVVVDNEDGDKVLIVTASAFTKYVGNLTLFFDRQGKLQSFEGKPVFLNRSIPEDPKVKALLQPHMNSLLPVIRVKVAIVKETLDLEPCSSRSCALGQYFADALLEFAKTNAATDKKQIAYLIKSFLRVPILKGDLTRGDIINTVPFSNKVVTITLAGRYLVEALEYTFANPWTVKPFSGPKMPHVAGLKAVLNATDHTASSVLVQDGSEYKPIVLDEEYQIVTFDFLARGLGGYEMFGKYGRNKTFYNATDLNVFEQYARRLGALYNKKSNRVAIVY